MEEESVKRLALVLALQAEIEAMKTANSQHPNDQPYVEKDFREKALELRNLSYVHTQQLFG